MNMLKILSAAIKECSPSYHEFKSMYKKNSLKIYGFVEGKTDPSFYRTYVNTLLPSGWEIELMPTGTKKNVVDMFNAFEWDIYPKNRVLFFIDRDLSSFVPEEIPISENLYITDMYSIENYVVNPKVLRTIIDDFSNFDSLPIEKKEELCELFSKQLKKFQLLMTDVMTWIIVWKRHGRIPPNHKGVCLNNINLKKMVMVSADNCCYKPEFKRSYDRTHIMHKWCNISYSPADKKVLKSTRKEFISSQGNTRFVRGKFLLWFMIQYLNSMYVVNETDGTVMKPKYSVTWGKSNLIAVIGSQVPLPDSLRQFINNTCVRFASGQN